VWERGDKDETEEEYVEELFEGTGRESG